MHHGQPKHCAHLLLRLTGLPSLWKIKIGKKGFWWNTTNRVRSKSWHNSFELSISSTETSKIILLVVTYKNNIFRGWFRLCWTLVVCSLVCSIYFPFTLHHHPNLSLFFCLFVCFHVLFPALPCPIPSLTLCSFRVPIHSKNGNLFYQKFAIKFFSQFKEGATWK